MLVQVFMNFMCGLRIHTNSSLVLSHLLLRSCGSAEVTKSWSNGTWTELITLLTITERRSSRVFLTTSSRTTTTMVRLSVRENKNSRRTGKLLRKAGKEGRPRRPAERAEKALLPAERAEKVPLPAEREVRLLGVARREEGERSNQILRNKVKLYQRCVYSARAIATKNWWNQRAANILWQPEVGWFHESCYLKFTSVVARETREAYDGVPSVCATQK